MTEDEFRSKNIVSADAYIAACDATCSPIFNPENVEHSDIVITLAEFIDRSKRLDLFKKLLFRGRTPGEIGMQVPVPEDCLARVVDANDADLIHGIIGVLTEAGELAELLLTIISDFKVPDTVNAVEEVGDILWYQSRILKWANTTFAQAQKINIDKLRGRHGATFDIERDANRDLDAERAKLEQGVVEPYTGSMISGAD